MHARALVLLTHPGRWLLGALLLDLAAYAVSRGEVADGQSRTPWVLLDLFLFWRVWRGGSRARTVLVFLGVLSTALGLLAETVNAVDATGGGQGWPAVLLTAASTACLLAPALDPAERPFAG